MSKLQDQVPPRPCRRCTLLGFSLLAALISAGTAHADGCFVWDKERDISGPTQKAILFHANGRQDLLLQVRYEGPVEQFGWLIPVPGLPTVRQGSMECFYELSKWTQQRFPDPHGHRGAAPSGVRVVEIKTVGDYEVAVLSPSDAGSLDRWLSEQGYVVPTDDAGIVEEYIRAGWYFIASKIQLNRPPRFNLATGAARSPAASRRRIADLRTKLATGELHPLLISFDTPRCVFPLKISALNGGPSEVSLYVLAAEPLLNRSVLEQTLATLQKRRELWEEERWERTRARLKMRHRSQTIRHEHAPGPVGPVWTLEELEAMERGSQVPRRDARGWDPQWIDIHEVVATSTISSRELPQNTKANPRLSGGTWQLTKITRTFALEEMRDLEFEPALPVLVAALPTPAGVFAAAVLAQFGDPGAAALLSACGSTHPLERINASSALRGLQHALPTDLLLRLLGDPEPEVRLNAAQAAGTHWDPRFIPPLLGLFRRVEEWWTGRQTRPGAGQPDDGLSALE